MNRPKRCAYCPQPPTTVIRYEYNGTTWATHSCDKHVGSQLRSLAHAQRVINVRSEDLH